MAVLLSSKQLDTTDALAVWWTESFIRLLETELLKTGLPRQGCFQLKRDCSETPARGA